MKKICLLLFIAFTVKLSAQEKFPVIATSGSGIGNIMLGMSEKEVRKLLVGEYRESSYLQKMKEFKSFKADLRIDSLVSFVLGFDKMLTSVHGNSGTPVFNLGFKDDKLNYIGITSYISKDIAADFLLDQSLKFFMTKEDCLARAGNDFLTVDYTGYDDHIYYKSGVELMYDEGLLRCVILFPPTPDLLKKMEARSKIVLDEFSKITVDDADGEDNL